MAGYIHFTPDREEAIWNCATACALRRKERKCRNKFGSNACDGCKINIMRYGYFDPDDAQLYMMQAEGNAYELAGEGNIVRDAVLLMLLVVLIFIGLAELGNYRAEKYREALRKERSSPKDLPPGSTEEHASIRRTLRTVSDYMSGGTDLNGDGLTNCIDAAVIFYKHYPDKQRVRIIENKHPDGRMWHLFNSVYTNGKWLTVEPQAHYMGHTKYWMKDIWKSVYDPRYDRNATEEYRSYAK